MIVAFLEGTYPDYNQRYLSDIMAYNDEQMEKVHDYIQWVFPLDTASNSVHHAPALEEEEIDEDEHDLVIEAIEEADPKGRTFPKFAEEDSFYAGDTPDSPDLNLGKRKNLDDLMSSSGKEFTGSFGRDEFEEFKARMTDDFYAESDEAIEAGDHQAEIRTENRVFTDEEDELQNVKAMISSESGLADPTAVEEEEYDDEEDENYSIDENGTEWFEDDDGYWWYREEGQDDWQPYEEDED